MSEALSPLHIDTHILTSHTDQKDELKFYGTVKAIQDIQIVPWCVFIVAQCNFIRASWNIKEQKLSCRSWYNILSVLQ